MHGGLYLNHIAYKGGRQSKMQRLTQRYGKGNWSLIGVPWGSLREGMVITGDMQEKLYGALYKLKDYEDTGLTPEQLQELKEQDTAKPLLERHYEELGEKPYIKYICPNGCKIQPLRKSNFCSLCGQRLKWEE